MGKFIEYVFIKAGNKHVCLMYNISTSVILKDISLLGIKNALVNIPIVGKQYRSKVEDLKRSL
jgi:hypothetical protein